MRYSPATTLFIQRARPEFSSVAVRNFRPTRQRGRRLWLTSPAPRPYSCSGGAEGSRTPDPKTASLVLSQLSYSPTRPFTLQAGLNDVKKGEGLGRVGAGGGIRTHTPLRARVFETREYRQFLHSGTSAKRCRSYYHRPSRSPARRRKTHRKKRFGNLLLSEKTRHVRGIVHPAENRERLALRVLQTPEVASA